MKIFNLSNKEHKTIYHIRIQPYYNNRVSIFDLCCDEELSDSDDYENPKIQLKPARCVHTFLCSGRCAQMNPKVVENAILLLKKKENKGLKVDEKELLNRRILNIENSLEDIVNKLNILLKS